MKWSGFYSIRFLFLASSLEESIGPSLLSLVRCEIVSQVACFGGDKTVFFFRFVLFSAEINLFRMQNTFNSLHDKRRLIFVCRPFVSHLYCHEETELDRNVSETKWWLKVEWLENEHFVTRLSCESRIRWAYACVFLAFVRGKTCA